MTLRSHPLAYAVAAAAALVALIYALIGANVVTVVVDQPSAEGATPMFVAGALFAVLAVLAVTFPRRRVWIAGAGLQILVILGYLVISTDRTPSFEPWGLGVKALQVGLLVALVYLAVAHGRRDEPA